MLIVHVIAKPMFTQAARLYPRNSDAILRLYRFLVRNNFDSSLELKRSIASLDNFKYVDGWYVIDIGGNDLRFIGYFDFNRHLVLAKHILTHAEYDKLTNSYR